MATPGKPSAAQAKRLLEQVDRLVLVQTNVFIRELLREVGKRPGANKAQFRTSLEEAISEGALTQEALDSWLRSVEGWGNQHIYAFTVPAAIANARVWRSETDVAAMAEGAFPRAFRASTSNKFPDDPKVARVDFDPARRLFVVEWHERTDSWVRDPEFDAWPVNQRPELAHPRADAVSDDDPLKHALVIDGDTYWFKALRRQPARSVMRFAILLSPTLAKRPIAALFVRTAVNHPEHDQAVQLAWRDLGRIEAGAALTQIEQRRWNISKVIKNLDDEVAHGQSTNVKSKKTRFSEGMAAVEFTAPPNLQLPQTIRDIRLSIPQTAIRDPHFQGSLADFRLARANPALPTSREAHVQLFHAGRRIRIWTELSEADVWTVLETLDGYR